MEDDPSSFCTGYNTANGSDQFPAASATLSQVWSLPATDLTFPIVFPDEIEVQVYATVTGATLVAAIELVSPGNKDRPEARKAFAAK